MRFPLWRVNFTAHTYGRAFRPMHKGLISGEAKQDEIEAMGHGSGYMLVPLT